MRERARELKAGTYRTCRVKLPFTHAADSPETNNPQGARAPCSEAR
jgi:hypothetical protein